MELERVRPSVRCVKVLLGADYARQVSWLPAFDEVLAVEVVDRSFELEQELQAERDASRQQGGIAGAEREG